MRSKAVLINLLTGLLVIKPSTAVAASISAAASPAMNTSVCAAGTVKLSPEGRYATLQPLPSRSGPFAAGLFGDPVDIVAWPDASGAGSIWRVSEEAGAASFMTATQVAIGATSRQDPVAYRLSADSTTWVQQPGNPLLQGLTPLANYWTAQFVPSGTPGTELDGVSTEAVIDRTRQVRSEAFRPSMEGDGIRNLTRTFDGVFALGGRFGRAMEVMELAPATRPLGLLPETINRTGFPGLAFARTRDGSLVVYDTGVFLRHTADGFAATPVPIYSEPVLAPDATVVGHFTPTSLSAEPASRFLSPLRPMIDRLVDRGWTIRAVAADPATGRAAILVEGGGVSDRALILHSREQTGLIRCDGSGASIPVGQQISYRTERLHLQQLRPEHSLRLRQIGPVGHKMAVWTTLPRQRPVGHVLAIRGGPQATVRDAGLNTIEQTLLQQGYAIHRFDYAGTIRSTPELFSRLRTDFAGSLATDARTIAAFERGLGGPGRTILLAESFGTVLAAQLHRVASSRIDATVLMAPMAKWVPLVSPLAGGAGQLQTIHGRRQHYEAYGAPIPTGDNQAQVQAFSDQIDNLLRPLCDVTAIHVFVGRFDMVTPPSDWEDGCLSRLPRTIVADAGHGLSPGMEAGVLGFLSEGR